MCFLGGCSLHVEIGRDATGADWRQSVERRLSAADENFGKIDRAFAEKR